MMKALITGGAGFIGSHLAEELLEKGQKVCVIDDLSTGSYENIKPFLDHDNFYFVHDTILNEMVLKKLIDNCGIIYHLAAAVGVQYMNNPLKSLEINIRGTEIVLELASRGKKKVILASSSEIYGNNGASAFTETSAVILGATNMSSWGNAWSKALNEYLAFTYFRERDLPVVIIRLFNISGPRQTSRSGKVIPRFVKQALLGIPITIYEGGRQTRGFTDVNDAVTAIIDLAQSPRSVGEIFNLGNPQSINVKELACRVKELTQSPSKIIYIPYRQVYKENFEDPEYRVSDIRKLHDLTGYFPKVSLDEIILRVAQFINNQLIHEPMGPVSMKS